MTTEPQPPRQTGLADTNISRDEHFKHMEALEPYIDLMEDADEFEQSAKALYNFHEHNYLSDGFRQAYYREVKATLEWLKENVKIKERKKKVVETVQARKYLDYGYD
jgi:hypothetical protein